MQGSKPRLAAIPRIFLIGSWPVVKHHGTRPVNNDSDDNFIDHGRIPIGDERINAMKHDQELHQDAADWTGLLFEYIFVKGHRLTGGNHHRTSMWQIELNRC